ncbi:MAG: RagB/SusD family nutrient uptake outer membrane protein, partial [Bacteroidales bacterium]|nr:RagB/SusD family nutrient uptake outer membrane protein [Bacteroidales bacterium]
IVIDNIMNVPGEERIKQLGMAEARLLRAWEHFVVVNTYAKAYDPATAATDGGTAIMDKYDLEASPKKSTVEEVYNFIMKEIDEALPYLQETPDLLGHPSKAYGYGLKALVCLFHRDWQAAKDAAEQCLALNNTLVDYTKISKVTSNTDYRYTGGKDGNPEVLDPTTSSVGFTGTLMYNYGQISKELTDLFDQTNDQRYALFFQNNIGTGAYAYYFELGAGASCWLSGATLNRFYYSTVGLRTAEVYLIKAECQARLGDISGAMKTLSQIRKNRIKGYDESSATASSVKDAMEQIIVERRKELLFGFHRFWDLKRLNIESDYAKTITREFPVISTTVPKKKYVLNPNSRMYIIPFPKSARARNPHLTLNTDE